MLYMAPEVFQKQYDEKCDIWSVGVILFILLTGVAPFNQSETTTLEEKIKSGKYSKNKNY